MVEHTFTISAGEVEAGGSLWIRVFIVIFFCNLLSAVNAASLCAGVGLSTRKCAIYHGQKLDSPSLNIHCYLNQDTEGWSPFCPYCSIDWLDQPHFQLGYLHSKLESNCYTDKMNSQDTYRPFHPVDTELHLSWKPTRCYYKPQNEPWQKKKILISYQVIIEINRKRNCTMIGEWTGQY